MTFPRSVALVLAIAVAVPAHAQPTSDKTDKAPAPKLKAEMVPGYTPKLVEGFTVVLSDETMRHLDDPDFKKKPIEVLEQEFKAITAAMPAKSIKILQRLLFFIEWDNREKLGNGRVGRALAVYYGGHQINMLAKGMPPLKAKNITVLSMASLTREHQPERDSGRCVLLHEIAHAVHDQLLGPKNATVFAAYKQALERKFVDKDAYAATNEMEFFAEMTCAYYDQLDYHPRTREALQKLDPVTYKVMEEVWGKAKLPKVDRPSRYGSIGELPSLEKLDLGSKTVQGDLRQAKQLVGHPVAILYWNANTVSSFPALTQLQNWEKELGPLGLLAVAVHQSGVKMPDATGAPFDLKKTVQARGITIPVNDGKWYFDSVVKDFKSFPMCAVYSHDGRGIFLGSPFEAEALVRGAVGQAVTEDLDDAPKQVAAIVEALREGKTPVSQFGKLTSLSKSKDEEIAKPAGTLLARLTEPGTKILEETEAKLKDAPYDSYVTLERLIAAYKETPVAFKAATYVYQLRSNKEVANELRAKPNLEKIQKMESELTARLGPYSPANRRFRQENAMLLRQLDLAIRQMQQANPGTRAAEQALRIGERFGV
jgi:hypothetical protein